MNGDGIGYKFDFEVDPVVAVNVEGNVHHCDLEGTIEEGHPCLMRRVLRFGFGPENRTCDACIVHRVDERSA